MHQMDSADYANMFPDLKKMVLGKLQDVETKLTIEVTSLFQTTEST